MLTADAFGVLPPISRLSTEQARYHFLSGYTAKVAGTESGIVEPQATFSACFGAPFMALRPTVYSKLLGDKVNAQGVRCWLVNTGWTGGPYGVGSRMSIAHTRAMVNAALAGRLDDVPTRVDPNFGLEVPTTCPDVPPEVLDPEQTWSDKGAYQSKARELAGRFHQNFKQFEEDAPPEVVAVGPKVGR
jgi:phosphoenolpyruvate carboxykinase (ATP)